MISQFLTLQREAVKAQVRAAWWGGFTIGSTVSTVAMLVWWWLS